MARYTAEEIITKREEVKTAVDDLLTTRLVNYHIKIDDISLVHVHFSQRFTDAVESKQIAEQEAKKAGFAVLKAKQEAEAKINRAKGEAEANKLIHATLTPDIIQKETINRWDGKLPLITDKDTLKMLDLGQLIKMN
jgi:regulator of protease activity HflC (stomatin/prohibitin superfamily)